MNLTLFRFIIASSLFIVTWGRPSQDAEDFLNPKRFKHLLKKYNNDLESLIDSLDQLIFNGRTREEGFELRLVQRRLKRAENNIDRVKSSKTPNRGLASDTLRLLGEIAISLFKLSKEVLKYVPLPFTAELAHIVNVLGKMVDMGDKILESIRYYVRKREYEKRKCEMRQEQKEEEEYVD